MASRLAKCAFGAARLRPTTTARFVAPVTAQVSSSRQYAAVPAEEPKKKAQSIVDSLPGNSLVSKVAILSSGAAVSAAAISNEFYVFNEESIVAFSLLTVFFGVGKFVGPLYSEWAQAQSARVQDVLTAARQEHTAAVQQRIESVKGLEGVVDITKTLFEVSKETATLESQAFELEQQTALAAEAKSVLDSWVRYEGQVKQREQKELAESIIGKIEKELENPKVLKQILDQSVAEVERLVSKA